MKRLLASVFVVLAAMFLVACGGVPIAPDAPIAQGLMTVAKPIDPALIETRYCGAPKRDANGVIIRRQAVITAYWAQHVCPTTGLYKTPCADYALNHNIPLACGGCDAVSNLSAIRIDAKKIIDGYERKINAANPPFPDTAACPPLTKPLPLLVVPAP
jgi:hypothetical protein